MPETIAGSATVLSTDYTKWPWFHAYLSIEHGTLRPSPGEVVRVSDGSVHELCWASEPDRWQPSHCIHVMQRDPRDRHLEEGDVITWGSAEAEGRVVHADPLEALFKEIQTVQARDGVLDAWLANEIDRAESWLRQPWYEGRVECYDQPRRVICKHAKEARARSLLVEEAMLLEALRRVLHTVRDVRRGSVPNYHQRILRRLDRLEPLTKLARGDREVARPLALQVEAAVLKAALTPL